LGDLNDIQAIEIVLTQTCGKIDAYDRGNGSVNLAWPPFPGLVPDSYNVYVNGVLNQNVAVRQATVSGLTITSYAAGAVPPPVVNGPRPQNMPPIGVVTPSGTYDFKIVAVKSGIEVAASMDLTLTVQPQSIMLKTPMKRLWPFPNTGLD
jgi:hypothetical protein